MRHSESNNANNNNYKVIIALNRTTVELSLLEEPSGREKPEQTVATGEESVLKQTKFHGSRTTERTEVVTFYSVCWVLIRSATLFPSFFSVWVWF
jgi:hypothetical protein